MDFHEYRTLEEFLHVDSADSVSLAAATWSIHFQLKCGMLLRVEALYVLDLGASLLSVPQLIKDGIDVSFHSRSRTAYIRSDEFMEQPLDRCMPPLFLKPTKKWLRSCRHTPNRPSALEAGAQGYNPGPLHKGTELPSAAAANRHIDRCAIGSGAGLDRWGLLQKATELPAAPENLPARPSPLGIYSGCLHLIQRCLLPWLLRICSRITIPACVP
jgi:hypothetical protein